MVTKIQKWGNSPGLRIPKTFVAETGVEEESSVDISLEENRLVISPIRDKQYRLFGLLSLVRQDHRHWEISTGNAVGRGIW
jgi:antitoxin MazE